MVYPDWVLWVDRLEHKERSSTSEQAIDIFRRSLNQANQSAFANVSGLGLTSADDSPSSETSVHRMKDI